MSSFIEEIYESIQRQTKWVANEMEKAKNTGLGIQEESITDFLLNNIQTEHNENFITKKFSHKNEGCITGADWLWCIGEPGSWITFAIQAKITNINSGRVNHLLYKDGYQYSKLISFSKLFHFIPKYSIYTKFDEATDLFSRKASELRNMTSEQWSFSSISPKYIIKLTMQNERHYSNVLQFAVPWSYVFNGNNFRDLRLAEIITNNLEKLYWSFENEFRHRQNRKPKFSYKYIDYENPEPSKMISKFIPLPILYLMTKKITSSKAPVSNVGVMSNVPVNLALSLELKKLDNSRQWINFQNSFSHKIENIRKGENCLVIRNH